MANIQSALTAETRAVVVGPKASAQVAATFTDVFGTASACVIADDRTFAVLGAPVVAGLRAANIDVDTLVFPGDPELYASHENCLAVKERLTAGPSDTIAVVVGSGTLNDLTKRASGELGRGYLVVGTAASMDGYTSFGASLAYQGFKQTMSCPAPTAVICDLDVFAAAPKNMTASGYGDLIAKVPGGADWILADAMGVHPLDDHVWQLVQGPLAAALAVPIDLAGLTEGLLMSGLAMQVHGSSLPASGAEHYFSHLWEMEGHGFDQVPRLSHGFKVGIGTIAVCALYERLLARDLSQLDIEAALSRWETRNEREVRTRRAYTWDMVDETVSQALAKWVPVEVVRTRLETLTTSWPELSARLRAQLLPAAEVQRRLAAVGAPATPDEIGISLERLRDTYLRAQLLRSRYTVLDVCLEAGILHELVDELFAPGGFWSGRNGLSN